MRILHFADVHLDRPFVGLSPDRSSRRRRELFEAFRRCLALALERQVDLVTIGGDLWEDEHVLPDTRASVAHELRRLGVPVLIVCGNHDRLRPGGSYRRTSWPDNVTIAGLRRPREYRYADASVWAVSWGAQEDLSQRMIESVELTSGDRTNLLLIHGTAQGSAFSSDAYFPFAPEVVERSGFALCLAGHVHGAMVLGRVVYPGSPEPLGWGEENARHCAAVIECRGSTADVELVDINQTRYETRALDCSGCGSSAEVDERLRRALTDEDAASLFVRLRLAGEVSADCQLDVEHVAAAHGGRYGALVVEDTTEPLLDMAARAERPGLDGLFVRKLLDRLAAAASDAERRRIQLALEAGVRAIEGRKVIPRVN
jgi:DNA repair exonuclease SbcCD nuclease subunit